MTTITSSSFEEQKTVGKKVSRSKTGSILVLDDEFDISMLVKQILQRDNFKNIFAFTDPLLALEHFRINHKDYSLIISDIRMPTMNGFEFVREAKKINPKVKILLMTAFEIDDKEFARVLPKPKIDGLIQKPTSPKQILKTVSIILKD
jgi:response regulator RpfG family c-di-GMP phosphodiesterase